MSSYFVGFYFGVASMMFMAPDVEMKFYDEYKDSVKAYSVTEKERYDTVKGALTIICNKEAGIIFPSGVMKDNYSDDCYHKMMQSVVSQYKAPSAG